MDRQVEKKSNKNQKGKKIFEIKTAVRCNLCVKHYTVAHAAQKQQRIQVAALAICKTEGILYDIHRVIKHNHGEIHKAVIRKLQLDKYGARTKANLENDPLSCLAYNDENTNNKNDEESKQKDP
eukprot:551893_1